MGMTIGVGVAVAFWANAEVVEPMSISNEAARVAIVVRQKQNPESRAE
jgi:hypothetical protein